MSTHGARENLRGYHRRKNLDLNVPPSEVRDQEGPSTQEVQASQQGPALPPAMIDVESIDDDIMESSPRAFAEVCFYFLFLERKKDTWEYTFLV